MLGAITTGILALVYSHNVLLAFVVAGAVCVVILVVIEVWSRMQKDKDNDGKGGPAGPTGPVGPIIGPVGSVNQSGGTTTQINKFGRLTRTLAGIDLRGITAALRRYEGTKL